MEVLVIHVQKDTLKVELHVPEIPLWILKLAQSVHLFRIVRKSTVQILLMAIVYFARQDSNKRVENVKNYQEMTHGSLNLFSAFSTLGSSPALSSASISTGGFTLQNRPLNRSGLNTGKIGKSKRDFSISFCSSPLSCI